MLYSHTLLLVSLIFIVGCHYAESASIAGLLDDPKVGSRDPIKSPGEGGVDGEPFDDVAEYNMPNISHIVGIRAINISFGDVVNSIQVTYILANTSLYTAPVRGRAVNNFVEIRLGAIEHVSLIEGSTNGSVINDFTITTLGPDYERKVYGPFGKPGLNKFSLPGYVIGFHGRSGLILFNVGLYSLGEIEKSEEYGPGTGGTHFDDEVDIEVPPVVRLLSVKLWHGDFVDGLQAEYLLLNGSKHLGERHGGSNSSLSTVITLQDEEILEEVELRTSEDDGAYISMLTFTSLKKDGTSEVFGPFGRKGDKTYSLKGNIIGFHGHAGLYIDRLGFYYI